MRSTKQRAAWAAGILLMTAVAASAQAAKNIYAQQLVDEVAAKHPDVVVFAMHVTAPGQSDNTIIASNVPAIIGKKSDADDLKAVASPEPVTEVARDHRRFEVLMQLQDRRKKTIGAVAAVFKYAPGDNQARLIRRAVAIRNRLRARIPSLASLFQPAKK
jgi:hypothetical protein